MLRIMFQLAIGVGLLWPLTGCISSVGSSPLTSDSDLTTVEPTGLQADFYLPKFGKQQAFHDSYNSSFPNKPRDLYYVVIFESNFDKLFRESGLPLNGDTQPVSNQSRKIFSLNPVEINNPAPKSLFNWKLSSKAQKGRYMTSGFVASEFNFSTKATVVMHPTYYVEQRDLNDLSIPFSGGNYDPGITVNYEVNTTSFANPNNPILSLTKKQILDLKFFDGPASDDSRAYLIDWACRRDLVKHDDAWQFFCVQHKDDLIEKLSRRQAVQIQIVDSNGIARTLIWVEPSVSSYCSLYDLRIACNPWPNEDSLNFKNSKYSDLLTAIKETIGGGRPLEIRLVSPIGESDASPQVDAIGMASNFFWPAN